MPIAYLELAIAEGRETTVWSGGGRVATVDERVAYLEGRSGEQSRMIDGVREALVSLEARIDRRFEAIDRRFEAIEQRLAGLELRVGKLELRMGALEDRLGFLEVRMANQFLWLVGIQVTTFVAIVGAILAR